LLLKRGGNLRSAVEVVAPIAPFQPERETLSNKQFASDGDESLLKLALIVIQLSFLVRTLFSRLPHTPAHSYHSSVLHLFACFRRCAKNTQHTFPWCAPSRPGFSLQNGSLPFPAHFLQQQAPNSDVLLFPASKIMLHLKLLVLGKRNGEIKCAAKHQNRLVFAK
jgi:hypothetical protein